MVDGIAAGDRVILTRRNVCTKEHPIDEFCESCEGSHSDETQDFRDAEMIVVESLPLSTSFEDSPTGEDGKKGTRATNNFKAHCIYGSKIVSTEMTADLVRHLTQHTIVKWATKKPYILNGDWVGNLSLFMTVPKSSAG